MFCCDKGDVCLQLKCIVLEFIREAIVIFQKQVMLY